MGALINSKCRTTEPLSKMKWKETNIFKDDGLGWWWRMEGEDQKEQLIKNEWMKTLSMPIFFDKFHGKFGVSLTLESIL